MEITKEEAIAEILAADLPSEKAINHAIRMVMLGHVVAEVVGAVQSIDRYTEEETEYAEKHRVAKGNREVWEKRLFSLGANNVGALLPKGCAVDSKTFEAISEDQIERAKEMAGMTVVVRGKTN